MHLFDLVATLDPDVSPAQCKLHLAGWNGIENPLDVYMAGDFDAWQRMQTRKNFNRPRVVALIAMPEPNRWLFAGIHDVHGPPAAIHDGLLRYRTSRRERLDELCGRLVIAFRRTSRQSYLNAERWVDNLHVAEIRPERIQVIEFPGYTSTLLTKQHLDIIVKHQNASWKSALSSVKGVYVIVDRLSGKQYVGSATGEGGIWSRWCAYATNGHGGNVELRDLLGDKGTEHAAHFQYGVLETADSRATVDEVLKRESHWKKLLLTIPFGHNKN